MPVSVLRPSQDSEDTSAGHWQFSYKGPYRTEADKLVEPLELEGQVLERLRLDRY